jgi:putative PIN family toxin of toxin-antitoxin system
MQPAVLDTNIALDLLVFADPRTVALRAALADGALHWLATEAMRDELARVLGYPKIAARVAHYQLSADAVLAGFDVHSRIVEAAPKAPYTCGDPDDQKFIDLAAAHGALLLSKDFEVLRMSRRLERLGARVASQFDAQIETFGT